LINVHIHSPALREQPYKSKKDGSAQVLHLQTAYFFLTDKEGVAEPYPSKVEMFAQRDKDGKPVAYPAGKYQLHPSSVYLDQSGRLAVAPHLVPVKA